MRCKQRRGTMGNLANKIGVGIARMPICPLGQKRRDEYNGDWKQQARAGSSRGYSSGSNDQANCCIALMNSVILRGLVMWPSMPARRDFSLSSSKALAEKAMIFSLSPPGRARMAAVAS